MKKCFVLCALCLVLGGFFSGCSTEKPEKGTKVLMIGNSFSISLLQHLPQVAADCGVELDLASLYIGGCSLERHWTNVVKDVDKEYKPYLFGRNRFGKYTQGKANVCDVLRMAKWDIVTVQQASHESWRPETYHPYGDNLVAKIRELAPQAKIYVQETWSYTPWDKRFARWGMDQNVMYSLLHAAYADFAKKYGFRVIPMGTAVQEWRRELPVRYTENTFGGDVVGGRGSRQPAWEQADGKWVPKRDVFHLSPTGEYLQALVWTAKLFGADVTGCAYRPDCVTEAEAALMKKIAMKVVAE